MSSEGDLPNIELDRAASVYLVLGQLKTQVELLLKMENNRGAELTRILDGYQKSSNSRMDQIERDLESRTDRLEREDSTLQKGLKESTEKFEAALKATNDTVSGLRDKVTGAVAILALVGVLSPFLPRMIGAIIPPTPHNFNPSHYPKP